MAASVYELSRSVTLTDPDALRDWWLATVEGEPEGYDEAAALELLLADEHLTDLDRMGFVSLGAPDVWREGAL